MKICFSGIAWTDVGTVFSKFAVPLESEFNDTFSHFSYGGEVDQFIGVLVAVDSMVDATQNAKFLSKNNKSGSFKHLLTREKVKFISIAIPYQHEGLEGKTESQLMKIFCADLYKKLDNPEIKIPKGFDYKKFTEDMKNKLSKYF
jgi:hypothetical protein